MRPKLLLANFALLLLFLCGFAGGAAFGLDEEIVRSLTAWRQQHPQATSAIIWITHLGGSAFLLPFVLLATAWLLWKRQPGSAAWTLATVLGGRAAVELIKWATDRPRPEIEAHPVWVASQAFPSGHAANSMITYLAAVLVLLPPGRRSAGLLAAVGLSLVIGATRPFLGVHWPTDVVGGWLFGLVWVAACWAVSGRIRSA